MGSHHGGIASLKDQLWNQKKGEMLYFQDDKRYILRRIYKSSASESNIRKTRVLTTVQLREIVAGNRGKQDLRHVQTSSFYLVLGVFLKFDWPANKWGKANLGQLFQFDKTHTCDRSGFLLQVLFFLFTFPGEKKDRNPIPLTVPIGIPFPLTLNNHKKPCFDRGNFQGIPHGDHEMGVIMPQSGLAENSEDEDDQFHCPMSIISISRSEMLCIYKLNNLINIYIIYII